MSVSSNPLPVLRGRLAALLGELQRLADPAGAGGVLLAAMSAEAGGNVAAIQDAARQLGEAFTELQAQLRDVLNRTEQLERREPQEIPGADTYWAQLNEDLRRAAARSADEVLELWLKSFGRAFAEWNLNVCERLCGEQSSGSAALKDIPARLAQIVTAIRAGERTAALPGLMLLVDAHPAGLPKSPLDEVSRAAVFLVIGRIRLYDGRDGAEAREYFEKAREAAPQDGRVFAALAEYHRANNDAASMRDLYRQAIAASPDRPDGYVGMALSCEAQGWWDEAQSWYTQAVEVVLRRAASADPLAELGQLLAPVSGALYFRVAQALGPGNPAPALAAVEKAIQLGVKGPGKYPQRTPYQMKGEILEALRRPGEAARAFFESGQYNYWGDDADAGCKLFERANRLDPAFIRNYWSWADALLASSYLPKPPYVDAERISQSLDVWSRGASRALPDDQHGWAYLTRAIIAVRQANLPEADRWECYWQAVSFLEQSLLLSPTRTLSWVTLGQMHYALGDDLNALHATETALLCDTEDVSAIEERLFVVTNLNLYPDARALLVKRSMMEPPAAALVSAMEAHLALNEAPPEAGPQAYKGALVYSLAAINAGATAPWIHIERALLLRRVGRPKDAQQEYADLWRKFDRNDVDSQTSYAWAALMIGKYDEGLDILASRSNDRVSRLTVQRLFGFCRLLRGEVPAAQEHFNRAIELAHSARELDLWLVGDFESGEVLQQLAGCPYAEQAREMLEQCKKSAEQRRAALHSPSSAREELQQLIAELERKNDTTGWQWIGAHAAAARLSLEAQLWEDAEEHYRKLQNCPGRFYLADRGVQQALYGLVLEGQRASTLGVPQAGPDNPSVLTAAEKALPDDRAQLSSVYNLRTNLECRRSLTRRFGQSGMQRVPVVTPITIKASGNLSSLLQANGDNLEPQFARQLALMRLGLHDLLGFSAPDVRVRINEADLPDSTYILMLDEVPLVSGKVDLTRAPCNVGIDRLTLLGVKGEAAVDPATGSECAWVGQSNWQKVKDAGLTLWTPAEWIIRHLSAVIRSNAAELMGIQAVADLLKDKGEEQHSRIISTKGGLPRFTSVIQALLAEEVPIKELESICDCYLDTEKLPTWEIPEEIRCLETVRKDIPGNSPEGPMYKLGQNLVSRIAQGLQSDGEATVLALEPEPTQEILTAIRSEVRKLPPTIQNPVLFVEDWRMRPFVRKLVELEFPHLAVLSRREACAPDTRPVLATIEIEPGPRTLKR
jgi:tetratricopeptide (TPR) repeat protein